MAEHQSEGGALVAALRATGLVLSLDAEGDIDLGGRPKAMRVWTALAEAIEDLPKLVASALREELSESDRTRPTSSESVVSAPATTDPPDPALARWESLNNAGGINAVMEHSMSGGEPPLARVPAASATISQPAPGRVKLPPCPRYAGYPVICPQGQAWVARRDRRGSWARCSLSRRHMTCGRSGIATIRNQRNRRLVRSR
jgi:hypothetical protein